MRNIVLGTYGRNRAVYIGYINIIIVVVAAFSNAGSWDLVKHDWYRPLRGKLKLCAKTINKILKKYTIYAIIILNKCTTDRSRR